MDGVIVVIEGERVCLERVVDLMLDGSDVERLEVAYFGGHAVLPSLLDHP